MKLLNFTFIKTEVLNVNHSTTVSNSSKSFNHPANGLNLKKIVDKYFQLLYTWFSMKINKK